MVPTIDMHDAYRRGEAAVGLSFERLYAIQFDLDADDVSDVERRTWELLTDEQMAAVRRFGEKTAPDTDERRRHAEAFLRDGFGVVPLAAADTGSRPRWAPGHEDIGADDLRQPPQRHVAINVTVEPP